MVRLEDELRTARKDFAEKERRAIAMEAENASAQRTHGELLDRLTSLDAARQRATEEKAAIGQKLNERDFSIQSLMHENAGLKSEAYVPIDEFKNDTGGVEVQEGDFVSRTDADLARIAGELGSNFWVRGRRAWVHGQRGPK